MEKKILIIVENLPVPFDSRVWQEATTLTKAGYVVSVICPTGKGYSLLEEVIEGVNIFRYPLTAEGNSALGYLREYSSALINQYSLAKKIYRKIGFSVIMGCNPPDNIFLIALMFRRYGVKYVFDHHDICPELFEVKFNGKKNIYYRLICLLERLTYKHCAFSFATNESYKEIAVERGHMNPDNVTVLRSAPSLKRMIVAPPKSELKKGFKYMVGYLGVIGQQEGIEYILQCAEYFKSKENDTFWVIVGGGPHLDALREQAKEMGLEDCVLFTGRVPDSVMLEYMNTADVCVNSDIFNPMNDKSTMNKVMEYMALGKPIVQFDLKEGRVSAQDASLYAAPNDYLDMSLKIRELLNNPEKREQMGKFGRERVLNELNWENSAKVLIKTFDRFFNSVLIVGPSPYFDGGVATVNRRLISSKIIKEKFLVDFVETWKSSGKLFRFFSAFGSLLKKRSSASLIHVDVSKGSSTYRKIILSYLFGNTPYIVHIHSGIYARFFENSSRFIKNKIIKLLSRAEQIVCVSDFQKREICNTIPQIKDKVVRVYNGINLTGSSDILKKNDKTLVVLFFGALLKTRHIEEYLKLADEMREFDIKFLIAGSGKPMDWTSHNVEYLGSVTGEEKENVLSRADILYDNFIESFGIGMVEAMNHGCCVLGLNDGAIPEIVEDKKCGLLASSYEEFKSNLETLHNDRNLLYKLQQNAYERSLNFSNQKFEKEFLSLYTKVLEK